MSAHAPVGCHLRTHDDPCRPSLTALLADLVLCDGSCMVHSTGINISPRVRHACVSEFNRMRPRSHLMWTVNHKAGGNDASVSVRVQPDGAFPMPTEVAEALTIEEQGEQMASIRRVKTFRGLRHG